MSKNCIVKPPTMESLTRAFILLAGTTLLFLASALGLANLANPADLSPPNDPLFQLPIPTLFWIAGGLGTVAALVCFFAREARLSIGLVALLASAFLGCRVYVAIASVSDGFGGYLGGLGGVYGLRGGTADVVMVTIHSCLLAGCLASALLERKRKNLARET